MPTAIALRSFDHNGPVRKGDHVTFDEITMKALRRSGLVSKEDADEAPKPAVVKKQDPPKAVKGKPGKKSVASPAAPASQPPIAPPPLPGDLLPPPIVK